MDSEEAEPILDDFEVLSLDNDGIDIDLSFHSPYNVSAGDDPDLLLLQLNLGDYKSEQGINQPESVVKYI